MGCSFSENENSIAATNGILKVKIDSKSPKTEFSKQIATLSILGLEETERSLLDGISRLIQTEEDIIIFDDQLLTGYRFNKQGKFLNSINSVGKGPNEYEQITDVIYRNNNIEIYNGLREELLRYDKFGVFQDKLRIPYTPDRILFIENHYLLSRSNKPSLDSMNYHLIWLDDKMNELKRSNPYDKPNPFPLPLFFSDFRTFKNKTFYSLPFNDTIYGVSNGTAKPLIHFDFGEDWLWTEELLNKQVASMRTVAQKNAPWWIYSWLVSDSRIEVSYYIGFEEIRDGFFNRETNKFYLYSYPWEIQDAEPPHRWLGYEGDQTLMAISTDALELLLMELESDKYKTIGYLSLEQILNSENPVVLKIEYEN
ncbi:hypothetical protein BFP71_14160 [Roseivirga misakiensis]|uniref:6-bladed beta-propeller n=2 Tax=Roseivirga misakiensis TaxID=1563681 RepID=A0A1E5SZQ2_9BACT|nr:hypothetical protein BFP71_14160 [Roseivirga misakiensis]